MQASVFLSVPMYLQLCWLLLMTLKVVFKVGRVGRGRKGTCRVWGNVLGKTNILYFCGVLYKKVSLCSKRK